MKFTSTRPEEAAWMQCPGAVMVHVEYDAEAMRDNVVTPSILASG
jgi:hypothetical protein